jgi:hypothetical protein
VAIVRFSAGIATRRAKAAEAVAVVAAGEIAAVVPTKVFDFAATPQKPNLTTSAFQVRDLKKTENSLVSAERFLKCDFLRSKDF